MRSHDFHHDESNDHDDTNDCANAAIVVKSGRGAE
jgi:hypothetical protein